MPESDRHSLVGLFSLRARLIRKPVRFNRHFQDGGQSKKNGARHYFQNAVIMYVCTCMYVCMCVCMYVCMCVYVCMYVYMYSMYVCMYYVCMCVCVCVYACMYVFIYVCVYVGRITEICKY